MPKYGLVTVTLTRSEVTWLIDALADRLDENPGADDSTCASIAQKVEEALGE